MRLLLLFFLLPTFSIGQNHLRVSIQTKVGMGWWIYTQGQYEGDTTGYIGYRRSHASMTLGHSLDVSYAFKKVSIGSNFIYGQFLDKKLFDSKYTIFNLLADTVSATKIVTFYQPGITLEYYFVKNEQFEWAPHIELGYFGIKTTHPDKSNFGFKGYVNIGFMHRWWFKRSWGVSFIPIYNRALILPKNSPNKGERHDIFSFTAGFGLHYRFLSPVKNSSDE